MSSPARAADVIAVSGGDPFHLLAAARPFSPPAGLDLTGLRLAEVLVLPHHDCPGRAERHAAAQAAFAGPVRLEPLRDGELVVEEGARISVLRH